MRKRTMAPPQPAQANRTAQPRITITCAAGDLAELRHFESEEAIRLCAYQKWEAAGKPGGDGLQFWLEAERQLSNAR